MPDSWMLREVNKFLEKSTSKLNEILFSPILLLYLEDVSGGLASKFISPVSVMIPF